MKKWIIGLLVVWLSGLLVISPKPVLAACSATATDCPAPKTVINDKCCDSPSDYCGTTTPAQMPTAIGCIPINPSEMVRKFLGLAVGIGGGIAFILMLFGSFQIMASGGDPKSIQAGKELITATLTGLLLIIFSVFILKLVGVDILGIPGLQKPTP